MSVVVKVYGAVAQPCRGDGFLSRLWSGAELLRVAKDAHYRPSPRLHDLAAGAIRTLMQYPPKQLMTIRGTLTVIRVKQITNDNSL